ncbi:MAG: oligosaccharide flippase family protein [Phycisphaerae bacterium]|nr:oligosaccharide flippase family protein [Phycisphaerae bacterium]
MDPDANAARSSTASPEVAGRDMFSRGGGMQLGGTGLSLAANFRWMFAGNIVNALCQWGMLAALARLADKASVGHFVLGMSIAAPILALTMLQLRSVLVTDARDEYAFADYFGNRILWTAAALVAIVAIAVPASPDASALWIVIFVGVARCSESLSDIVRGLFQRRERMDLSGISLMLKGLVGLAVLILAVRLTGNVPIGVATMALSGYAIYQLYDMRRAHGLVRRDPDGESTRLSPRFHWPVVQRLTVVAFPLGIVMALITLQANIPRYFLQLFAGSAALGYFGAIVYPMMAGIMVTTALGQAASPRLAVHYLSDRTAFLRLLVRMCALSAALGVLLILGVLVAGDWVLWLIYGPDYTAYHAEFLVVSIAMAVQLVGSCLGFGLTAARHFRSQAVLSALACLVTTIASLALIPDRGVMGAAWAVVATSLSMTVGFAFVIVFALRRPALPLAPGPGSASNAEPHDLFQ